MCLPTTHWFLSDKHNMHWWKVAEPEGSLAYQPQMSGGIRSWNQRIIIFTFLNGSATCIKWQAVSILLPLPHSSSHLTFSDIFSWGKEWRYSTCEGYCNELMCACWGVGSSWGSVHFTPSAGALCSWMWRHALQGRPPCKAILTLLGWLLAEPGFTLPLCQYKQLDQPVCQRPFHTQRSQAHQSKYHSAMIQYSVLIHLASTWKDLTTCTVQAPCWDSGNRNRPVITK